MFSRRISLTRMAKVRLALFFMAFIILAILIAFAEIKLIAQLNHLIDSLQNIDKYEVLFAVLLAFLVFSMRYIHLFFLLSSVVELSTGFAKSGYKDILDLQVAKTDPRSAETLEGANFLQPFFISIFQLISNCIILSFFIAQIIVSFGFVFSPALTFPVVIFLAANLVFRYFQKQNSVRLKTLIGQRFNFFGDLKENAVTINNFDLYNLYLSSITGLEKSLRTTQAFVFTLASSPKYFLDLLIVFALGALAWRNEINGAEFQSLAIFGLRALPYVTMVFLNISKVYAGLEPVKKFLFYGLPALTEENWRNNKHEKELNTIISRLGTFSDVPSQNILITGRSGSGKTTVLMRALGVRHGIVDDPDYFKEMEQKCAFFLQVQPRLNCTFGEAKKLLRVHEKFIFQLGLDKTQDEVEMQNISGGELQRFWLAATLSSSKSVLIFDEPTNNLDEKSKSKIIGIFREEKRTIVVVSHDESLVAACLDMNFHHLHIK